ncbi:MAG: hypothetical protein IT435_08185 [Phycisphaerales bacterium]|nr:hypothetical protein [Phycisphaerales bacterium]
MRVRLRSVWARGWGIGLIAGIAVQLAHGQDALAPYLEDDYEPFGAYDLVWLNRHGNLSEDNRQAGRDILEGARIELTVAQRALERARYRLDVETPDDDQEKRREAMQTQGRALEAKFRSRREQIEREYLADLRMLLEPSQDREWQSFLHDRRIMAFRMGGGPPSMPRLRQLLTEMPLSSQEKESIAKPLIEHEAEFDKLITEYLGIWKQRRDVIIAAGDGDISGVQMQGFQSRMQAVSAKVLALSERAARTIAGELTPENAAILASRIDVHRTQSLLGITVLQQDQGLADLMRISTLTKEQKQRLRALVRSADAEIAKHYKPVLSAYEARSLEEWRDMTQAEQESYEKASKGSDPVYAKLRQEMNEVLTADQRRAMDEGAEPPLRAFENQWRDDIDRAR